MSNNEQNEEKERLPLIYRPMSEKEADDYAEAISTMQRFRFNPMANDVLVTFVADMTKDEAEPLEMVKSYPCKHESLDMVLGSLAMAIKVMGVPITLISTCEVVETGQETQPTVLLTHTSACPHYNTAIVGTSKENALGHEATAIIEAAKEERTAQIQKFWSIAAALNPEYKEVIAAHGGVFVDEEDEEAEGFAQVGEEEFVMGGGHDHMPSSFEGFSHLSDLLDYLTENDLLAEGDED